MAWNRLVVAGPVPVTSSADGSAHATARVAEVRVRDGRQLRLLDVDLEVSPGNLTTRRNYVCSFTAADGTTYTQGMFVKQWTSATASGSIGVFDLVPGPATPATSTTSRLRSSATGLTPGPERRIRTSPHG